MTAREGRPADRITAQAVWTPGTALVVDGDPVSRRFVELALGKDGLFVVEAAESAAAAIEILRVQSVELIIADTDLSDANGLQFYRALTQESRLRGIPFVFLSVDRRPEAKIAALRAGVADYLIKPCHGGEFAARAIALVERERRIRAGARRRNYLLSGELSAMGFPDLVNTIEMGRRSGVLSLVLPSAFGQVFFAAGRIVHALYGNVVGPAAVHRLVAETAGSFEFAPGECAIPADQWTVHESATSLILEGARLLDHQSASGRPPPRPVETMMLPVVVADLEPPLGPMPGLVQQLASELEDPFALGEMYSWSPADLARWTRRVIGGERLHVLLIADLAAGVSAILPLCASPSERWVLSNLQDGRKAFGVTFFLRRERTVDIVLLDITEPDAFDASLKRTPSLVIVAPPSGDVMSLGLRTRIALENLLRKFHPQALLVVGNPSIQHESALRDLTCHADLHEFADGILGDSSDELRGLLARGIRAWGQAPADTRVVSLVEEVGA
ncbi:MAG TPA: response regulator [Kofleriaceae bacterium]|nr:response regulator [Kofleriaceae bacterium]